MINPVTSPQSSRTVALAGTAEANAKLTIAEGSSHLADVTAGAGGAWAHALQDVADGTHTYAVVATDAAGNVSAPASLTVRVDTAAPQTTLERGAERRQRNPRPTFEFSASEAARFECRIEGAYADCASPVVSATLADGTYRFSVRATDAAGNVGVAAQERRVHGRHRRAGRAGDRAARLTAEQPDRGPVRDGRGRREGDAFRGVRRARNGGGRQAMVPGRTCSSRSSTVLTRTTATATDLGGNVSPPASMTVRVDATAPQTSLQAPPPSLTSKREPSVSFSADETSTFECRLDGPGAATGTYAACSSPVKLGPLADGAYRFLVRATDAAGNLDSRRRAPTSPSTRRRRDRRDHPAELTAEQPHGEPVRDRPSRAPSCPSLRDQTTSPT